VRVELLVALTVLVLIYGGVLLLRHYSSRRQARELQPLQDRLARSLAEQRSRLTGEARKSPGPHQRDAAALTVQLRRILAEGPRESGDRVDEFLTLYRTWESGDRPSFRRGEPFLRGYLAPQEGAIRPYTITVPEGYTPDQPTPLVVYLPGRGEQAGTGTAATMLEGAIGIRPGLSDGGGNPYLEQASVMAMVNDVRALYTVDPARVFVMGYGKGGTLAWQMAAQYPDVFRAVAPMAAATSHDVWTEVCGWNPKDPPDSEVRDFLHSVYSPVQYAPNLTNTRAAVLHATGDTIVPVQHAREMVSVLTDLGVPPYYREFPDARHGNLPDRARRDAMAWLFGSVPRSRPREFTYRTDSLSHNRAWWLRLDQLGHPLRFARADARVQDGTAVLDLQNVERATVVLSELPADVHTVRVGQAEVPVSGREGSLSFHHQDGGWARTEAPLQGKRQGLSGPAAQVFSDRFIIVYGTGSSLLTRTVCEREARRFKRDWGIRYGGTPRVVSDANLDDAEWRGSHIILIGGPGTNSQTERFARELPVKLQEASFQFAGRTYAEPGQGLLLCRPNPLQPERLVLLAHGNSPAALYQCLSRFGLWINGGVPGARAWFDFGVFDQRTAGPESFLHVGFFGNDWSLPADGAPGAWELRGDLPEHLTTPQGFPAHLSITEAMRAQVDPKQPIYLSDLMPDSIEQPVGAVGFDRSYAGDRLRVGGASFEKGLGVKAPSSLTYSIGGLFRRFSSTVSLDSGFKGEARGARLTGEKVVFEVWGDGELLTASPELSWHDDGRVGTRIHADLSGVFNLRLVVRPVGDAPPWLYGAASWCAPAIRR
jgi:predicted esterase